MAEAEFLRYAEDALDAGTSPREVVDRFGRAAIRERRLGPLLLLLEQFDPGRGASAVGQWAAERVDDGDLVLTEREP